MKSASWESSSLVTGRFYAPSHDQLDISGLEKGFRPL